MKYLQTTKQRVAVFALAVLALAIGVAIYAGREPVYQGHTLSFWLGDYQTNGFSGAAVAAVKSGGDEALDSLMELVRNKEPRSIGSRYRTLWEKAAPRVREWLPRPTLAANPIAAGVLLGEMGPAADKFAPELVRLIQVNSEINRRAPPMPIDPKTMKELNRANERQMAALLALRNLGGNCPGLVPTVLNVKGWPDTQAHFRAGSTVLFSKTHRAAVKAAVPYLINVLGDSANDVVARCLAALALGLFIQELPEVEAALRRVLSSSPPTLLQDTCRQILANNALLTRRAP